MKPSHHDARGFSLLELTVVVGVFGILLAISVPVMSRYLRTSRLMGTANTLVADLHYARSLANAQRKTFEIRFSGNTYQLVRVSPESVVRTRTLPLGIACTASNSATFFAWGLTQPATVTVRNDSRSRVVRLAANGSVTND